MRRPPTRESERGRIATATGETLVPITAIIGRFTAISEDLSIAPKQHAPIFEKSDDDLVLPRPWSLGVLGAMRLCFDAWRPMLDLNRIEHGLLLPILLHCRRSVRRPTLAPPREGPETEAFLSSAYHDIPLVIPETREF